jgi:4-hydroxy-3-polyprenylbenzoate decarboxylase
MKTLRAFLDALRRYDELKTIDDEIHWDLQAAAICGMSQKTGGPAVHFTNVSGYSKDHSLVGSLFSGPGALYPDYKRKMWGRIAVGLGLEPDTPYDELMEVLTERRAAPIKAMQVDAGPAQECVIDGDQVDIYKFPIPRANQIDGGRYLTQHVILVKDPDSGWISWSSDRCMVLGKDKLVDGPPPPMPTRMSKRHIDVILDKYKAIGKPMPFAIVIGASPGEFMTAMMAKPAGTDEASIAGGLMVDPVTMAKAKLSDILVPVDAEIILEGHVYPGEVATEGPYTSISRCFEKGESFVYTVELISHRKEPIFPFIVEGCPVSDTTAITSVLHANDLLKHLRRRFFIKFVALPVEAKLCLGCVSVNKQLYAGVPQHIAHNVFANSPYIERLIILDGDVDYEDTGTMIGDSTLKAHSGRDYHFSDINRVISPTANHDLETGLTSTLWIDATWRIDRPAANIPRRVSFETCFPYELQKSVIDKWKKLGLHPDPWWREDLAKNVAPK